MKFFYLLIAVSFFSITCRSQTDSSVVRSVHMGGRELIKASTFMYAGTTLSIAGTGIIAAGLNISTVNAQGQTVKTGYNAVTVAGGIVLACGIFATIRAYAHIGAAGIYFTGNGIVVPIRSKKKL